MQRKYEHNTRREECQPETDIVRSVRGSETEESGINLSREITERRYPPEECSNVNTKVELRGNSYEVLASNEVRKEDLR